jgi:hypothetical protein
MNHILLHYNKTPGFNISSKVKVAELFVFLLIRNGPLWNKMYCNMEDPYINIQVTLDLNVQFPIIKLLVYINSVFTNTRWLGYEILGPCFQKRWS